jgi:hypothetical protein
LGAVRDWPRSTRRAGRLGQGAVVVAPAEAAGAPDAGSPDRRANWARNATATTAQAATATQSMNLWVPKTCATCADASGHRRLGLVSGMWLAGSGLVGRAMIVGLWA